MKAFVVFATVLAMACAAPQVTIQKVGYGPSSVVRAPAHDSASIEHHRLGGNFAYAVAEAPAFASITAEISEATHPVAETTYAHQPAPIAHVQPAAIVKTTHAARPVIAEQAVYGTEAVIGPVRQHTVVEQPIYKQQHVTVQQPHVAIQQHLVAAPAVEAVGYAAAPAIEAIGYAAAPAIEAVGYAAAPAIEAVGYAGAYAHAGHLAYGAAHPAHAIIA